MGAVRFFTDEDLHGSIAPALRRANIDAVSTPEAGRLNESDESQLLWATNHGFAMVTFNVGDFVSRHIDCLQRGERHAGIVVSRQRSVGDVLRRLLRLANALDSDSMRNRLEFLSDW